MDSSYSSLGTKSGDIDDEIGHYDAPAGSSIGRYEVMKQIGKGTFGKVIKCRDSKYGDIVALKVIRNIPKYVDSAKIEADILYDVNKKQKKRGLNHCVKMYSDFDFRGHYCIVFERLGLSLYDIIKMNQYQGFSPSLVKEISRQLLQTLEFFASINLIHTDLKMENIMFYDGVEKISLHQEINGQREMWIPATNRIKIIDFGGATYNSDSRKSTIVNTRQYRGPEVTLEIGWSFPSDIWSAGCIIAEALSGELLFPTHDELEHIAMMEKMMDCKFPSSMINKSRDRERYFDRHGNVRISKLNRSNMRHVKDTDLLENFIYENTRKYNYLSKHDNRLERYETDEVTTLLELMKELLRLNPSNRVHARHALQMDYFTSDN